MSDEFDVVIIGSGAGGGACGWSLSKQGVRVCLIEAGSAYNYQKDYLLHRNDWESHGFPEKQTSSNRQTFGEFQSLDNKWSDLLSWNKETGRLNQTDKRVAFAYHHVRGVGGSTLHFAGEAHRMNPQSMNLQTKFGVAADWPVSYAELEPYYQIAEKIIGVAGGEDNRCWRSEPYPLPEHEWNYNSQFLQKGFTANGMQMQSNSLAILSRPYNERPACNHCNQCTQGCPRADKGSVDVTFIQQAKAYDNFTLKTESTVMQIISNANDKVSSVIYRDANGIEHSISARVIVVACGAVETPRLLLNSESSHAKQGLANDSGEVGKNFMETVFWQTNALHSESLGSHRGVPSDVVCWDFNDPDSIEGVIGGCRFSSGVGETELTGPVNYAKRVVSGWGKQHKQTMREQFGKVISIGSIGESLPNEKSYIELDVNEKDEFGLAKAKIHSFVDEMEINRLSFMKERCRAVIKASGGETVFEEYGSYDYFSATHVFGTCRMGDNAEASVVNSFGQSHRFKNLFIADASVFPSSGGGEAPSLTIEALALRISDRISELLLKKQL